MPLQSRLPSLTFRQCNVLDYLFSTDEKLPSDSPIWIDTDDNRNSFSPRQMLQWVKRLGFGLERLGIKPGDVCMIFTPNHIYVPAAYLGFVGSLAAFSGANPANTVHGMLAQKVVLRFSD